MKTLFITGVKRGAELLGVVLVVGGGVLSAFFAIVGVVAGVEGIWKGIGSVIIDRKAKKMAYTISDPAPGPIPATKQPAA